MKSRRLLITVVLAGSMSMLAGCEKTEPAEPAEQVQEEISQEEIPQDAQPEEEASEQPEAEEEPESTASGGFSFADVADREFEFSSGAGGWYTVLYIHEDGTFDGHFQDSDMGVNAPEYPNGTLYYSDFTGSFTTPEKVDDTTYVFQIESIEYPLGFGEEIKDGYYYDYITAYGLDGAADLYMYLPGSRIADLPEAYRSWVGYYDLDTLTETELPFYGLYNEAEENGFSSYSRETVNTDSRILPEIEAAEAKAAELENALQNAQTQADLNTLSGELYTVWDDTLNAIWEILKEELSAEDMKQLTAEELQWIDEKEAAVQAAGAEVEGGSMYSMVVNQKAADLTKERVYELAEYLK